MNGPQPGALTADPDTRPHPIHEAIRREAERMRGLPAGGVSLANEVPALAALMNAARAAIDASLPAAFEFHGRTYFLRSALAVRLEVFDTPAAAVPLATGASISGEAFGHAPGH